MKKSKLFRLSQALLGLSLLVGCAPKMPALMSAAGPQALRAQTTRNDGAAADEEIMVPLEGESVQALPAATAPKALTYLSYEALDSNLFSDLNPILDTLEGIGSNAQMNLLSQTDNYGFGNTARYYLQPKGSNGRVESPFMRLTGAHENSGDPRTLTDAVRWGFNSYPARINWLNVSTHGEGFQSINRDDHSTSSHNIMQFAQAVKTGLGPKKLDILSFDACMMAMVEVASELQDSANILVGSEDSTYFWGKGFGQTFAKIAKNPAAMNPDQVVRSMVVDIHNRGAGTQTHTISATDLRKIGLLETELDKLARALRRVMPTQKADVIRAVQASKEFHLATTYAFRDINRMVSHLKRNVRDAEVAQICDQINRVLYQRGVIMFSRQSKQENGEGRGLAIYLPSDGNVNPLYRQTRFAKTTQWDEFLLDLNQAIKAGVR